MSCTAPEATSGAMVLYRIRCCEPSSRSMVYSLPEMDVKLNDLPCFVVTHDAFVEQAYFCAPHREAPAYLCSSVSGSTRIFSCRSNTLRNTKESRLGFGTANNRFGAQAQLLLMFLCRTPS